MARQWSDRRAYGAGGKGQGKGQGKGGQVVRAALPTKGRTGAPRAAPRRPDFFGRAFSSCRRRVLPPRFLFLLSSPLRPRCLVFSFRELPAPPLGLFISLVLHRCCYRPLHRRRSTATAARAGRRWPLPVNEPGFALELQPGTWRTGYAGYVTPWPGPALARPLPSGSAADSAVPFFSTAN